MIRVSRLNGPFRPKRFISSNLFNQAYNREENWETLARQCKSRAGWRCERCGEKPPESRRSDLHAHHIIPLSKGGRNSLKNLQCLCKKCHRKHHKNSH
jgi:5-methylcytosine-specific restriction endonuclease McrA